jgi:hypothetical protein
MLKMVYSVCLTKGLMSSLEGDGPKVKWEFKGRFGASPSASPPIAEASHEEIDAFVKNILGLVKEKE